MTRYALAYPERRFSLVSDGRLLFQSTGSGKLFDVLMHVYGLDAAKQMLPLGDVGAEPDADAPHAPIRVTGYASAPGLNRSNRSQISLFVNRRWFQDTSVAYSVIQAYHTLLTVGRYPAAVVFIEIEPSEVDVNVHPTKAEVRFRDPGAVFGAVQRAVRETLVAHAPVPQYRMETPAGPAATAGADEWAERRAALLSAGRAVPTQTATQYPLYGHAAPVSPAEPIDGAPLKVPLLRVVGQMGATYIVAEGPDGMYLIDQHAAHERILYEQMLGQHARQQLASQTLLEPVTLDVSPEHQPIVAQALDALNEWGIGIEPFGGDSFLLRQIPAILSKEDPQGAVTDILEGLTLDTDPLASAREAALVTLICKRAAVKGGQSLSLAEMQEMVRQLEACAAPRTCPHGRPTMLYLSAADLARQFERT